MNTALKDFCNKAGIQGVLEITPIRSGRNSAVFKVSSGNDNWIIKNYFIHKSDKRDRLNNEYKFLNFLYQTECQSVAKPIAYDEKKQLALFTYLRGIRPYKITEWHIDQATNFIIYLNHLSKHHANAKAIDKAAEACLDLGEHLQIVDLRFEKFKNIQPECDESIEILNWVRNILYPSWIKIRSNIFGKKITSNIQQITLSPSDFGFHNTLEYRNTLSFVDFEYAGWDSTAKLVCDFICQPELPITGEQSKYFLNKMAQETNDHALNELVHELLPLHRVKWICILLNVFGEETQQRRSHSGVDSTNILSKQLNKARKYYEDHLQDLYIRN